VGTVYLIHLDTPLGDLANPRGQARHYLGYADNLEERLERHRNGNGARLLEVANELGIGWQVVRTWTGTRELERQLKRQHNSPRFCPICTPRN
jgi:predicted GIY-YIG superfamily endonuclease